MITAQKFAANIRSFSKLDEAARALFAETVAYAMFQYHAHGNKTPFITLQSSDLPGWIKDAIKKVKLGKRETNMTPQMAELRGDSYASATFASQAEKRAIAKVQREARAEKRANEFAPAPAKVEPEVVEAEFREVTNALIINGEMIDLSASEAEKLTTFLMSLRTPALKVA